ncbi:LysR family transcriptional regulator [Cupriavidus taiwanensis]|uniref:LysR family transcriptional regulator n=1 Tax=Cupriavidus taiwanensis TaxID=164546 RepID=A0A7Z7JHR1_9BURK|nr:LysR family transcriptional regulator [Cupriavidus taiwanensis]SOZ17176.1 LysR family transcriptional regulator [Cupriavidus taiwanensis]SOZ96512.1 LysR family transcriptional regulator [Cupriavidus taiwanensis]SPC25559.1 LysR family transcriptional regulator [Cupriavidus taiwanensis]
MSRNISLRHLRYFAEVANSGSFTTAASRLFVTQSALTSTIQQFEEAVGLKLFDRNTRRVVMTPEAFRFKDEAEKIIKEFDAAIADLEALAQSQKGHIRIAAAPSTIYQFLVKAVMAFRVQYPDVTFSLRDASAQQVEQLVVDGELDFAIASKHKGFAELDYSPLLEDRFGVVCRPDYRLASGHGPLQWNELVEDDYIGFTPDTGIGTTLRNHAPRWPAIENPQFEISSSTSLLAVLNEGGCFAIVPALTAKVAGFESLAFRELVDPGLSRELCLITRRLRSLSPSSQRLVRVITETIRQQNLPEGVTAFISNPA